MILITTSLFSIFLFFQRRLKSQSHQKLRNTTPDNARHATPQRNRFSPTTSAVDGVGPSHLPPPLASSRDCENALALLHAMMVIHRRSHAALARFCWGTGSVRAFALASCRKNACISVDSRPPRERGTRSMPGQIDQSARDTFSPFFVWRW